MAEDRDRPAAGRRRAARQPEGEVQRVGPQRRRRPRSRADRRQVLQAIEIVRRAVVTEDERLDVARGIEEIERQRRQGERGRARQVGADLTAEEQDLSGRARHHRVHGRAGPACLDLVADFLEHRGRGLRGEHAGGDHGVRVHAGRLQRIEQRLAVGLQRGALRLAEVQVVTERREVAGLDRIAGGVAHAVGNDEGVA